MDAKCDHDAKKLLLNEPFKIPYKVVWLRSSPNPTLEHRLQCVFESIETYDDRKLCLDYAESIDKQKLSIYLIVQNAEDILFWESIVKSVYKVNVSSDNINRLVLKLRNDVRSETSGLLRPIEKSTRRHTEKYVPFVSLMANLDLYVALSWDCDDRMNTKNDMLAACRLSYQHDQAQLKIIDQFEKDYDGEIGKENANAIYWYTRECDFF